MLMCTDIVFENVYALGTTCNSDDYNTNKYSGIICRGAINFAHRLVRYYI